MQYIINNKKQYKENRQDLRVSSTPAEEALWKYLKKRQLLGRKFRRQHSIGAYIADFYCPSERLIIELDGEVHRNDSSYKYDQIRDNYLRSLGIRVLRFENKFVFEDLEYVLGEIKRLLNNHPLPPP